MQEEMTDVFFASYFDSWDRYAPFSWRFLDPKPGGPGRRSAVVVLAAGDHRGHCAGLVVVEP
jgi:hypothetical protein